jgi:hypothetical protein
MIDARTQERLSRSCSDATFGYFNAANAAWAEMTQRSLAMWSEAMAPMLPPAEKPAPRSWYRHPDEPRSAVRREPAVVRAQPVAPPSAGSAYAAWPSPLSLWLELMQTSLAAIPRAAASRQAPAAMPPLPTAWPAPLSMLVPWWPTLAGERAMTAWPMLLMMVAIGIPRSIAEPAAEANAAALDAAEVATQVVSRAFSRDRKSTRLNSSHNPASRMPSSA